jgi:hypothetical protein
MHQGSSDIPEEILHNQNNNNFNETIPLIGSADTLKRAMTVNKLSDMLDCIHNMKLYAKTIEKDLPDYFESISIDRNDDTNITKLKTEDFIQLAKQRMNDNRYILLSDLIKQKEVDLSLETKSTESQLRHSTMANPKKFSLDKQMKCLIAAQPSALEAIYLEALLNFDQWESNHHLLQTSPMDNLTTNERKRLNELLFKCE